MLAEAKVLGLVRLIYEAAADASLWPPFLEEFSDAVRGSATGIVYYDLPANRGLGVNGVRFDPEYLNRWVEHFSAVDRWLLAWKNSLHCDGPDSIAISEELVLPRDLMRTEFFNDYLLPQDTVHQLGGAIFKDGPWVAGFTCLRSQNRGPFGDEEVDLLRLLFPHLQRAVQMQRKLAVLEGHQLAALDALDRLPVGVIFLDGRGKLLINNRAAKRLLDQNDGLTAGRDGLTASIPDQHIKLRLLVSNAALTAKGDGFGSGGSLGISRQSGKRPFSVLVMPTSRLSFAMGAQTPAVIVFVSDPDDDRPVPTEMFARIYSLTAAEARLANQLMQGQTLVNAAERLGVSHNTARTHLQKIYQKTNTSHQGDLVRLLHTCVLGQ